MTEFMQHVEFTFTLLQREKFTTKQVPTLSVTGKASEHQLPHGTSRESAETTACLMPIAFRQLKEELAKHNIVFDLSTKAEVDALREQLKTVTESRDHIVANNVRLRKELDSVARQRNEHLVKLNTIFDSLPHGEYRSTAKSTPEAVSRHIAELNQRLENQRRLLDARDVELDGLRKQVEQLTNERDQARLMAEMTFDALQDAVGGSIVKKVENNLFNSGDLNEKLAKAEAKVQKLTERLAKCGMARVEIERRLKACAGQVKAERVGDRRNELALRIVLTHLYHQEKRKNAAADVKTIAVRVATRPEHSKVAVERFARFSVFGLDLDGLANVAVWEAV